jgi:AraC family transcriptional regulator
MQNASASWLPGRKPFISAAAGLHAAPECVRIGATENVQVSLLSDPPGLVEAPPSDRVRVCIHAGPPVLANCRHGREQRRGTTIYGDVDIIPPCTPATWELQGPDVDLVISVSQQLLRNVLLDSGKDIRFLAIRSRFQVRDPQIEHIGWALKSEMETGFPSGRLYLDSLAWALAARIVWSHSSLSAPSNGHKGGISGRKLREVLSFIEDNLCQDVSLQELSCVAGLSISHFKALFRQAVGTSPHQYLLRRRIDRATTLLHQNKLPIAQIALETGFCHQSHLARHMRRIAGTTPSQIRGSY